MKVPYSWLKAYVDVDVAPEVLADKLVSVGFEVEEIISLAKTTNVYTCQIVGIEKHPNADKLQVCAITLNGVDNLQIVTNAKNIKVGDVVPVALDGADLCGGIHITKGAIRGVSSDGMFCSGEELGATDADYPGASENLVLVMREGERVGVDINEILGRDDVVLDVSVTANRPDCQSILGIAREVAVVLGKELKLPSTDYVVENDESTVKVEIKDYSLCSHYMAREVRDIKIAPSPEYIQKRLRAVGIRPINNIVDITNYVLIELGQPMHAFDKKFLAGEQIVVRRAENGEKIISLDGKENVLNDSMLVICDSEKPCAVAGIMGGLNSGIQDDTTDIVFESARFARDNIRRTSKALNLRSDSSARFEKGVDFALQSFALDRALSLICEMNAGKIMANTVDCKEKEREAKVIKVPVSKVTGVLGIEIDDKFILDILNGLNFETKIEDGILTSIVPGYREDVDGANDLAEEVIRYYGYEHITATLMPRAEQTLGGKSEAQKRNEALVNKLVGLGYMETTTYSFISPKAFDMMRLSDDSSLRIAAKLLNPLGDDWSIMRTILTPSILNIVALNNSKKLDSGRLFEIAKVFKPESLPMVSQPKETNTLVLCGFGEGEDFFSMKASVEEVAECYGVRELEFVQKVYEYLHDGRSAEIKVGETVVGFIGEIHPDVSENFSLSGRTYVAELDLDELAKFSKVIKFTAIPKYPNVERDLALIVDEDLPVGSLLKHIAKFDALIEDVSLFDVYRGAQVESGKKSVALSISFRSFDHTLKDEEVQSVVNGIIESLEKTFGAKLR
ncbi:MAG: phenylalanine--tRNA ligase subunit beta [Clostridia bacterium]|nr:phenylalanine--tRNA ligase subunit beta [Clostridia bacterium]